MLLHVTIDKDSIKKFKSYKRDVFIKSGYSKAHQFEGNGSAQEGKQKKQILGQRGISNSIPTQFQQTPFWTKSTRCLVVSWSNFNSKFNFKQLCPLKSQNPTYGSQVTAISAPPGLNRVKMK